MEVIYFRYDEAVPSSEGLALALGDFDGLHRGHERLLLEAAMSDYEPALLLFSRPYGDKGPYLSSVDDKVRLALSMRIKKVYVLEVDDGFFLWKKEQFVALLRKLNVRLAIAGADFRFGLGAQGDVDYLSSELPTKIVPLLKEEGEKVSSAQIKGLIQEGRVEEANRMLGRPYEVYGEVTRGKQLGSRLGFPTMNVVPNFDYVYPGHGVYAGIVYCSGKPYRAMVNVGMNPTVGELSSPRIEAHLFDFEGEAYGKKVYVAFLKKIRDEVKFESVERLKEQLLTDEKEVKRYFLSLSI